MTTGSSCTQTTSTRSPTASFGREWLCFDAVPVLIPEICLHTEYSLFGIGTGKVFVTREYPELICPKSKVSCPSVDSDIRLSRIAASFAAPLFPFSDISASFNQTCLRQPIHRHGSWPSWCSSGDTDARRSCGSL